MKMAEEKIDNRSALERLFDDGDFEHLIIDIFLLLDGPTLETCSVVSKRFREIVKSKFYFKEFNVNLRIEIPVNNQLLITKRPIGFPLLYPRGIGVRFHIICHV